MKNTRMKTIKNFLPPSKEIIEKVRAEFGLEDQSIKEAVDMLKEWLLLQPHLPKVDVPDDGRLERWLIRSKNSLQRAKTAIDMYYTVKTTTPDLMCGWDTTTKWYHSISEVIYYCPMPKMTPDCDRIIVFGYQTPDPTNFIAEDFFKLALMTLEILSREDYNLSTIFIFDFRNYTLGHVPKITLSLSKKCEVCTMKGISVRMKGLHIINAPHYADIVIGILKSIFKSKLVARIHVHGTDLHDFHRHVPKGCLPTEYGGYAGSVQEHWAIWKEKLRSYQSYFKERENWKTEEHKRPGGAFDCGKNFGYEGSFRKLNID